MADKLGNPIPNSPHVAPENWVAVKVINHHGDEADGSPTFDGRNS